jgi:hypothetical protein
VYRWRFLDHRIKHYTAFAAGWSWFRLKAAGVMQPCRSISQVVL